MSIEEITKLVAPPESVQDKVISSLLSYGVDLKDIINRGDAIDVKTTVEVASKFFETKFFQFAHQDGKTIVRANGAYSIPEDLQDIITLAAGVSTFPIPHLHAIRNFVESINTNNFGDELSLKPPSHRPVSKPTQRPTPTHRPSQPKPTHRPSQRDMDPNYYFVPQSTNGMYEYRDTVYASALNTSQGVIQFESQYYSDADLAGYSDGTGIQVLHPDASTTVGDNYQNNPGVEAQLDMDAMTTGNNEATMWFWIEGGSGWLYSFTSHFFATEDVPQVISISYAWSELDQCQYGIGSDDCSALGVNAQGYVDIVNTEFQKIALRGISVLVASGDSGANGRTNPTCQYSRMNPQLKPDFPACSPWVTSVGGTELKNMIPLDDAPSICKGMGLSCAASGTEVAVSFKRAHYASGGGFSWFADQPSYQAKAVEKYFQQNDSAGCLPPADYFNTKGRGFPDIAAMGHNFLIEVSGSVYGVGGTSVSSPIMGSFFSLLNQVSIRKTGKTLGFLNPLIYQMYADEPESIFQDVVDGDNVCTESGCSRSCVGYYATEGWDAVTGLGTMKYGAAETYLSALLDEVLARKAAAGK